MVVVPILTVYADLFAILGGLIVGVTGLDLTAFTYIQQTKSSISIFDFVTSLIKAIVFAVLISGIGCQRGFQVRGGAEGVGMSTTSAVVSAIFLIVVFDSAFAIMLYYVRHRGRCKGLERMSPSGHRACHHRREPYGTLRRRDDPQGRKL